MAGLILYSTAGCHLCEEAQVLIGPYAPAHPLAVLDIADDEALLERYGTRIPVLRDESSGRELDWPFDGEDLRAFL